MNTTPGPWTVIHCLEEDATYISSPQEHGYLASVHRVSAYEANARLIAAAPELLAALRRILECQPSEFATKEDLWLNRGEIESLARIAIAKANGGHHD